MTSFVKNTLMLVGLVLVAVLGYYLFVVNNSSNLSMGERDRLNEAQLASEQFLKELEAIQNFELSDKIFTDERFRSFVDFTKPVQPFSVGRENPFAPTN